MQLRELTILCFFLQLQGVFGQQVSEEINCCTPQYDSWAESTILIAVLHPDTKQLLNRGEAKLEGVEFSSNDLSSLSHIDQNQTCTQIHNYIQSLPFINDIDENPKSTRYFYETDQFFFVFWGPHRDRMWLRCCGDGIVIAIKKDFSKHWIF